MPAAEVCQETPFGAVEDAVRSCPLVPTAKSAHPPLPVVEATISPPVVVAKTLIEPKGEDVLFIRKSKEVEEAELVIPNLASRELPHADSIVLVEVKLLKEVGKLFAAQTIAPIKKEIEIERTIVNILFFIFLSW